MAINIAAASKGMGRIIAESVYDNAVVTKEFRTRMRGTKPYVLMGGYVLLLGIVLAIAFLNVAESIARSGQYNPLSGMDRMIGLTLFTTLTVTQVVLLTLVLPSLTAGSITNELERQTIDMLALSRLTPGKVVLGKHLSGFLYGLVLLVCSLPLAGLCMLFGGISPAEVAVTYVLMATWAFMVTSAGVMWSSLFKKTTAASLCSYATFLAYMLLTSSVCSSMYYLVSRSHFGYGGGPTASGTFVFGVINPAFGPLMGLDVANVSGLRIPIALIAAVLEVGIGILMLMVASTHVRYQRANRSLPIRLLLVGLTAAISWLLASSHSTLGISTSSTDMKGWMAACSGIVLTIICLGIPMFATGAIRKPYGGTVAGYGLSLSKLFTNDLGGAIAFVAAWVASAFAAMGLSFGLAGKAYASKMGDDFWAAYWAITIASVAIAIGITALGVLFSSMCTKRRNATALLVLTGIVLFIGYGIMLMAFDGSQQDTSPIWQLAALWPFTPVMTAIDEWNGSLPKLGYESYAWIVTTITYLGIAFVALAAAGTCHGNGMGIREEE